MDASAVVCRNMDVVSPHGSVFHEPHGHGARGRGRLAMLWGISGTVVSAMGFICLSLFDQYNHSLTELQRDIKHFHEVSGNLVHKESMQRCYDRVAECIKEIQASATARAHVERDLETAHKDRRELEHELQRLRERLAAVEGRQATTPIVIHTPAERN